MAETTRQKVLVYVGTYTRRGSEGIYVLTLDASTGEMSRPRLAAKVEDPSFLRLDVPRGRLFAVSELAEGLVSAYSIDRQTGNLLLRNRRPSLGSKPCHLSVHPGGGCVLAANYGSGSVCALPVREDGLLGEPSQLIQHAGSSVNPRRQAGPHAHSVTLDAAGRFAYVADLGIDKVLIYRVNAEAAKLTPADPPHAAVAGGSGPRHLALHPTGRWAYLINEMGNTLTVFDRDEASGSLSEMQTIATLPRSFAGGSSTADVHVDPAGRSLYGSNRGHDSIVICAIDGETGRLSLVGHEPTGGRNPRNFALDPTGRILLAANQDSDNLVAFRIDAETGRLAPAGHVADVPAPVCVQMMPV